MDTGLDKKGLEELAEEGYIRQKRQKKKANPKISLEAYTSSTGTEFFVGKNNTQNDYLTWYLLNFALWHEMWIEGDQPTPALDHIPSLASLGLSVVG